MVQGPSGRLRRCRRMPGQTTLDAWLGRAAFAGFPDSEALGQAFHAVLGTMFLRCRQTIGRCETESVACVYTYVYVYVRLREGQPQVLSPGAREGSLRFLTGGVLNARPELEMVRTFSKPDRRAHAGRLRRDSG